MNCLCFVLIALSCALATTNGQQTLQQQQQQQQQQQSSPSSIADKIEPINSHLSLQQIEQQRQQQGNLPPNRNPFLDSLFNIPIQTLRAVNELVQGISISVQNFMTARPRPLRSVVAPILPGAKRRYDRQFINERYDYYY